MASRTIISRKRGGTTVLAVATLLSLALGARAQVPILPKEKTEAAAPQTADGRNKLKEARKLLAEGEFDEAEQMAREAGVTVNKAHPNDDSSLRVIEDVGKARRDARTLLAASRSALKRNDFDRAEKLALAAEQTASKLTFFAWGDSPNKVKRDIQAARAKQAKHAKLPEVKPATKENEKEKEKIAAKEKEKPSGGFFKNLFGSSNSKTEKEPAKKGTAKKETETKDASAKTDWTKDSKLRPETVTVLPPETKEKPAEKTAAKPSSSPFSGMKSLFGSSKPAPKTEKKDETRKSTDVAVATQVSLRKPESVKDPGPDTEQARRLLIQGREALGKGDFDKATGYAEQARALKPSLVWNEDNPVRLLRAIEDARSHTVAAKKPASTKTTIAREEGPAPAHSQQECLTLLREGRLALKQSKFEEVSVLLQRVRSYREAKYGLFDDSPDKLQSDMAKVRVKKDREESVHVLAQARKAFDEGDYDKASKLAYQAQQMHGAYNIWDLGDRPTKLISEIQVAQEKKKNGTAVASRKSAKPARPEKSKPDAVASKSIPDSPEKDKARKMLAEVATLQVQGKLLEAKAKLAEVEALKVTFKANEMSPALMQQQLAAAAMRQSSVLADSAVNLAVMGEGAPTENIKTAEQMLKNARDLVVSFDLDPSSIDKKSSYIARTKARLTAPVVQVATSPAVPPDVNVGAPPVIPPPALPPSGVNIGGPVVPPLPVASGPPVDADARKHGLELLELSRLEMRKGNLTMARRQAEEAYGGPFGVKPLAEQRLKEIDIEEYNQKRLGEGRNFDAAVIAFNQRDYSHAREILAGIRVEHLDEARQARVRELMASPEMGGSPLMPDKSLADASPAGIIHVSDQSDSKGGVKAPASIGNDPDAGHVTVSDNIEDDILKMYKQKKNIQLQALRTDSIAARREAGDRAAQGDTEGAINVLTTFIEKLPVKEIDGNTLAMIRKPIDSQIQKYQLLTEQNSIDRQVASKSRNPMSIQTEKILREQNKQKNVAQLMKQFNAYYKDAKYKEAEMYAKLASELDPDNPFATAAVTMARTQYRLSEEKARKAENEYMGYKAEQEAHSNGPWADTLHPVVINKERNAIGRERKDLSRTDIGSHKTPAMREIEAQLDLPVTINYSDVPLREVIESLHTLHNINIIPDTAALKQENISLERPVTMQLNKVALKSALNLILRSVDLTWVIRDDVLQVTTPANAKGKLVQRTYLVADLVTPIEDHKTPEVFDWARQVERLNAVNAPLNRGGSTPTPTPGPMSLQGGSSVGTPFGSTSQSSSAGSQNNNNQNEKDLSRASATTSNLPNQLMRLLQSSIAPETWAENAGPGTIEYFPLGLTLVINQTPDIQEQIADLLQQLRRLQDLEVAIEIRLISLSDNFFERMGVNFDVNILTNNKSVQPALINGLQTGQFQPAGFVQSFEPSRFISGLTPAGTFTSDLNIPINASSFGLATPPFGLGSAFTGNTTGGLAFGLAFLSDIQVKFFMEAAQGDQRFNVMQSPKLMMFNGQSASLNAGYSQVFVSGVQVAAQGIAGGPLFVPNATVQNFGTAINVQPVVTGDRRFVRVNVSLQLTNPIAQVPVFPVVVTVQPFIEGVGSVGNPSILTQFIQQPATDFIDVQTTAVVPDGGTVLLGGLKRLAEGRNEFGPPILSKIPYLNRLVKNVGYGRDTENVLMMITPRIVINEEEEIIQTGVISNPALIQSP